MASDETNKLIDAEIRALVDTALARAKEVLTREEDKLHLLAQALLEYETLTGDEIAKLLKDGKIDRPDQPIGPAIARPSQGSAIPKAGKRFSGEGGPAPQGA
jgi:cell division protease FtsH